MKWGFSAMANSRMHFFVGQRLVLFSTLLVQTETGGTCGIKRNSSFLQQLLRLRVATTNVSYCPRESVRITQISVHFFQMMIIKMMISELKLGLRR